MNEQQKKIAKITFIGCVLLFAYISIDKNTLQYNLSRLSASFGMNAVVLPNPYSNLSQELLKKERQLGEKEAMLKEKELQVESTTTGYNKKDYSMMILLGILFCLITINFYFDTKRKN